MVQKRRGGALLLGALSSLQRRCVNTRSMFAKAARHLKIVGALMMREMATRFGREGLGFAWIVGEPLLFCFGVMFLWAATKPEYEHGVRLIPFVMTGYMSLILIRHLIGALASALQSNLGLLYHRKVSPMHIFTSRAMIEIGGTTAAFVIVYLVLLAMGEVQLPHDYLTLYVGWTLLCWVSVGFALVLTGLAMRYDVFERLIGLISYLLIPLSGAFSMVAWLPPDFQKFILLIPFVHGVEMVRAGVFDEFTPTYFDVGYALLCGAVFNLLGLAMIAGARDRIAVE